MIRVVLDTNILVSGFLSPHGLPAEALSLCLSDPDMQLCMSADTYAEYEEVIHRPKFKRSDRENAALLHILRTRGFWVKPNTRVRACLDPDDDVFLECAQAAEAHYLVTGNTKHFPISFGTTRIVTAREFIDAVG